MYSPSAFLCLLLTRETALALRPSSLELAKSKSNARWQHARVVTGFTPPHGDPNYDTALHTNPGDVLQVFEEEDFDGMPMDERPEYPNDGKQWVWVQNEHGEQGMVSFQDIEQPTYDKCYCWLSNGVRNKNEAKCWQTIFTQHWKEEPECSSCNEEACKGAELKPFSTRNGFRNNVIGATCNQRPPESASSGPYGFQRCGWEPGDSFDD
mmetsp:Transcript_16319/g.28582  ORF Transcript_16319/g.28582 Transcript_16319/m.28582 type:complete len:209 (+) Transcript_16319:32-658(+)